MPNLYRWACGATWITHRASDPRIAGSNPVMPATAMTAVCSRKCLMRAGIPPASPAERTRPCVGFIRGETPYVIGLQNKQNSYINSLSVDYYWLFKRKLNGVKMPESKKENKAYSIIERRGIFYPAFDLYNA